MTEHLNPGIIKRDAFDLNYFVPGTFVKIRITHHKGTAEARPVICCGKIAYYELAGTVMCVYETHLNKAGGWTQSLRRYTIDEYVGEEIDITRLVEEKNENSI